MKLDSKALQAAGLSYIRSAASAAVALYLAGQTDPKVLLNAFIGGLIGPLARALNPKDKAFGITAK